MNMQKMLKEMQKMQGKLSKAQQDLESESYSSEASGGLVKVTISGKGMLTELKIDAKAVDPEDVEALEDLIMAAFNSAMSKKEEAAQSTFGNLSQGMKIPGMM
jgi:nucleoid-associated protein EbfC